MTDFQVRLSPSGKKLGTMNNGTAFRSWRAQGTGTSYITLTTSGYQTVQELSCDMVPSKVYDVAFDSFVRTTDSNNETQEFVVEGHTPAGAWVPVSSSIVILPTQLAEGAFFRINRVNLVPVVALDKIRLSAKLTSVGSTDKTEIFTDTHATARCYEYNSLP